MEKQTQIRSKKEKTQKNVLGIKSFDSRNIYLNKILANEFAVFTKTLSYHWSISGPRFHSLHLFLEKQYTAMIEDMDCLAESLRRFEKRSWMIKSHFAMDA